MGGSKSKPTKYGSFKVTQAAPACMHALHVCTAGGRAGGGCSSRVFAAALLCLPPGRTSHSGAVWRWRRPVPVRAPGAAARAQFTGQQLHAEGIVVCEKGELELGK